jgi:DNA-binding transcriptional LysR family regulator
MPSQRMAFTLRQLQYFIAVAEQGTVSGAAQALSISQSSVTEAVKELESDLGVTLFERHSRGLPSPMMATSSCVMPPTS